MLDYQGEHAWQWQLHDQDGALLAQQNVCLDRTSAEFQLVADLYRNLWLLDADPALRRISERDLLGRVGAYLASEVLGSVGQAIASRSPVTVLVEVPAAAVGLLVLPLDLADWGDGPLASRGTVFCYVPQARPPRTDETAGENSTVSRELRMLAVFALPETSSALGLVRERRALMRIVENLSPGSLPPDLRVLQYGATPASVKQALGDPAGWDIIHLAGHGAPGRLYLENAKGGQELVPADELLSWLAPCRGRIRLVVLSACESGVARAARILSTRRRPGQLPTAVAGSGMATAPAALGYEVARTLGCAVLATRYPVDDRFSVAFSRMWYEAILRDGRSADEALRSVLPRAALAAPGAPLSVATPILLGNAAARWRASASAARPSGHRHTAMSGVPAEAEWFTGRTRLLARFGEALTADSDTSGLVVMGMPGIGKTATITEASYRYGDLFEAVIWHRATRRTTASSLVSAFAASGADLAERVSAARSRRTLLIVDDAQALLDPATGAWRGGLGALIGELLEPGARSWLVLVSDRPLPGLAAPSLRVPMLSRPESEWLARELQEANQEAGNDTGRASGLPWLVCRGHPRLIEHCSSGTAEQIRRRTVQIDQAWEVTTPLAPGIQPSLGRTHPGSRITAWASERAAALPAPARRALCFLASIEQPDRTPGLTSLAWELLAGYSGVETGTLDEAIAACEAAGLAECSARGTYLLHPAVAHAARGLDREVHGQTVRCLRVIWERCYEEARSDGQEAASQEALGHIAASTVPYLMSLGLWEHASAACERAISHDGSPAMAGRLLPFDVQIVRATGNAFTTSFVYASLVRTLDENRGMKILTSLHERAVREGDDDAVLATTSALATLLTRKDPRQAYDFLRVAQAKKAAAAHPWLDVRLQNIEAEIRYQFGDWSGALAQAQAILDRIDQLASTEPQGVNPHGERGVALTIAAATASALGLDEQADGFRVQLAGHDKASAQRAASQTQFNAIAELIKQGRLDDARALLLAALSSFGEPGDQGSQGLILVQLANVAHHRGHHDDAITLGRRALRVGYAAGERLDAAAAHSRMANFLASAPGQTWREAPVHLLAAAVIHLRLLQELLAIAPPPAALRAMGRLTLCLARQPRLIPGSLEELQAELGTTTGVDIPGLLAGLDRVPVMLDAASGRPGFFRGAEQPGDSVTDALCWASHQPPPAELVDVNGHPHHWQDLIDAVADAVKDTGDRAADSADVRELLDDYRGAGWGELADALDALLADPGSFRVPGALPDAERAIIQRVLEAVPR